LYSLSASSAFAKSFLFQGTDFFAHFRWFGQSCQYLVELSRIPVLNFQHLFHGIVNRFDDPVPLALPRPQVGKYRSSTCRRWALVGLMPLRRA